MSPHVGNPTRSLSTRRRSNAVHRHYSSLCFQALIASAAKFIGPVVKRKQKLGSAPKRKLYSAQSGREKSKSNLRKKRSAPKRDWAAFFLSGAIGLSANSAFGLTSSGICFVWRDNAAWRVEIVDYH
jgi:hypothetical protein